MKIFRVCDNRSIGSGTYAEISLENFFSQCDLGKIFKIRDGEKISEIHITDFGIKAKFEFTATSGI